MLKKITAYSVTGLLVWNSSYAAVRIATLPAAPLVIDAAEILLNPSSLRAEITHGLQNPELIEALAKKGIQKQEVELRLAAMSDAELMQVQKGLDRQAGGEIVIGITALLLIIIIILLLR
jgi:prophage DNA circulation protein